MVHAQISTAEAIIASLLMAVSVLLASAYGWALWEESKRAWHAAIKRYRVHNSHGNGKQQQAGSSESSMPSDAEIAKHVTPGHTYQFYAQRLGLFGCVCSI